MWLDEIEITSDRGFARQDIERMARVLRELGGDYKQMKALCITAEQFANGHIDEEQFIKAVRAYQKIFSVSPPLSDDAKELLGRE